MPDAVAEKSGVSVGRVFAKFNFLPRCELDDLVATDPEQRANECHGGVDRRRGAWLHACQAAITRAAKQPEKISFDLIVGVMGQGDNGSQALGQAGEKTMAQLTGGRLYTFAALGGELLRVATIGFERQAKLPGRLRDE